MRWNRIEKHSDGVEWRCSAKEMNCYAWNGKGYEWPGIAVKKL